MQTKVVRKLGHLFLCKVSLAATETLKLLCQYFIWTISKAADIEVIVKDVFLNNQHDLWHDKPMEKSNLMQACDCLQFSP